jgi:hypothetical protein
MSAFASRIESEYLEVRSTDLNDRMKFFRLCIESAMQVRQGRQQVLVDLLSRSDVHCGWKSE